MRRVGVAVLAIATTWLGCSLAVDTEGFQGASTPDAASSVDSSTPIVDSAPNDDVTTPLPDGEAGPPRTKYNEAVFADRPVAYWTFDTQDGSFFRDVTGNGNDARIVGDTLLVAEGISGGAIDMKPKAALEVRDAFDFPGTAPFTFEAWIKVRPNTTYRSVFDKMVFGETSPQEGTWVYLHDPSPVIALERWTQGTSKQTAGIARLPSYDRFLYVVASCDGTNVHLYLDGIEVANGPVNAPMTDNGVVTRLGSNLDGVMDEIAIYDTVLPFARITAHMAAR